MEHLHLDAAQRPARGPGRVVLDPPARKPRLREEGQVYVTASAAQDYLRGMPGLGGLEEARRALTEVALEAYRTEAPGTARARLRALGLDLSLRISDEPPLIVVTSVHARDWTAGRGDREAQSARAAARRRV